MASHAVGICGLALTLALAWGCAEAPVSPPAPAISAEAARAARIKALLEPLRTLHEKPPLPGPYDWLAMHKEPGQSFDQYLRAGPIVPDGTRKYLYVQPLGEFTGAQREIVAKTAEFLGLAYGLEVRIRPDKPLGDIPPLYRRTLSDGTEQVITTYLLEILLKRDLPDDAVAMIAFTARDLWPGARWHFVFGQATLQDRVGVWSLARLGDPDLGPDEYRQTLLRTLKIAVHETGHMFTIRHCTAHRCVMAGNNGLDELDRTPLRFCPECHAKVVWATGVEPAQQFDRGRAYCLREGLVPEADFFDRSLRLLTASRTPPD